VTPPNRRTRGRKAPERPIVRLDALDRKRTADAQLAELKLARERGELVPAADVESAWLEVCDAVREALLGVPAELVAEGIVPAVREADADAVVRRALRALAEKGAPA